MSASFANFYKNIVYAQTKQNKVNDDEATEDIFELIFFPK